MDYVQLMKAVACNPIVTNNCPECNAPVRCDIMAGESECWCFNVQAKALEMNDVCLCKKCLTRRN